MGYRKKIVEKHLDVVTESEEEAHAFAARYNSTYKVDTHKAVQYTWREWRYFLGQHLVALGDK